MQPHAGGGAIQALTSVGLLAIGLVVNSAAPSLAQSSGIWTTTGSLNTARAAHRATLIPNGQVLVTGGETAAGNIIASAELYNPATGKWGVTGNMATPRVGHTAVLLTNGEILVAGGIVGFNCSVAAGCQAIYTATADLYNPSTGQWRTTGSMTMPRASHGATLLQNGQVLAAGGNGSDGSGNSAEFYDPSKGTWKATGNMPVNAVSPATLLQDGRVLIVDAEGNAGELYHPSTGGGR